MSEYVRHFNKADKNNEPVPQAAATSPDSEVVIRLKKIQEHLGFLERKLDMLLGQSPNRKPFGRDFSKPRPHFRQDDRPGFKSSNEHPREGHRKFSRGPQDRPPQREWNNDRRPFFNKKKRHPPS